MTAVKEVQPYSVAYEGERLIRVSTTEAPMINFDRKNSISCGIPTAQEQREEQRYQQQQQQQEEEAEAVQQQFRATSDELGATTASVNASGSGEQK
ncbi:hypothetical protein ECG_03021 [Echinococcus granulosus]|nr:hypothetical protein ECG_03021 [Echinococcus granulosus]